jgi:pimeloyl-ACP methyl ester carboxylesterase
MARISGLGSRVMHWYRRRWRLITVIIVVPLVSVYTGVSVVAASILTAGPHTATSVSPEQIGNVHEDVVFTSRLDSIQLRGWLFHAPHPNGRSVIFVHGWQANRTDTDFGIDALARAMLARGYDTLLFDLRSCGTSDGSRFTLGTNEPRDLLGAYDFMRSRGYDPARMAIIGDSMGAATIIEASPQLGDIGALVSDSAFSELRPLIQRELPKRSHLPSLFNNGVIAAAGLLYGVNSDLRPVDVVAAQPGRAFLFIQTTDDDFIPSADATQLYRASANPESRLFLVPAHGHVQTYKSDPSTYLAVLNSFLDQQIGERTAAVRAA